jgi:5-methylphenazine-1-carboxylate 1-monooxygenase
MRVGIVGAWIGGLTLALMLHERAIDVTLWESSPELRPLGVGINLLPHAMRELRQLGLLPELLELGIETSSLAYYNKLGQLIWQEPRGEAAGYPWPQVSLHRGELQMLLFRALQSRLGAGAVQCGQRAEACEQSGHGARVNLRQRDGSRRSEDVDVLVAADGIRSALRAQLYPVADDPLRYSGRVLWRGATESEPFADGRSMFMADHPDQKFVAYPIDGAAHRRGRSLINWIAELRVPELSDDDWNRRVDKSVFAGAFPIGSNGSAQAILDARCLADCLQRSEDPGAALHAYEAERRPKTSALVLRKRMHGPEQVMQLAEERAPAGFRNVEDVISRNELEEISSRYKQLTGFELQSLRAEAATEHGRSA